MTAPRTPGRGAGDEVAAAERDATIAPEPEPVEPEPAAAATPEPVEPAAGIALRAAAEDGAAADADRAPRSARILVGILLVLMFVPGVIGFDVWPLTGWRLFSLSRDADQTRWVLEAVDADGERRVVSLEELPLGYRHAEWPMAELPGASADRRDAVCSALLDAVVDAHPGTVELVVARDHAELVERDGEWTTTHDIEPFHSCTAAGAGPVGEGP